MITASIGIWQFIAQQRQANRKPFLEKQLELSFQATEAAAKLATEIDPVEWEKARVAFWRLYWGPLSIVEDTAVEAAMVELGEKVPTDAVATPQLPMKALGVHSYRLARAVRELTLKSWRVQLPHLRDERVG